MTRNPDRPLSPHLTIWRWGPGMLVSILHRLTGGVLAVAGLALLTWWLQAIAAGAPSYENFVALIGSPAGLVVLIGLTFAFWQHLLSGVRHLVMDSGAGFEARVNRMFAIMTIVASLILAIATWVIGWGIRL